MATKSILKTVYIKDNSSALKLASALETAQNKASKEVCFNGSVRTVTAPDEIRRLFEKRI